MAHCININHPEYKKLVPQFKGPEALLKAKISIWQENNGLDNFPTIDQLEERKNILYDKMSIEEKIQNQSNVQYQLPQGREIEEFVASEKTIRDLTARMSDRIGIPVKFESDRTKDYKGKLENNVVYINLAYATLDTPIHEILGHPIIRAIKYSKNIGGTITLKGLDTSTKKQELSQLYQNLLKELEYGKGKEVLTRIKRDYVYKHKEPTQQKIEIATRIAETFKKLGKPLVESTDRILNRPKYTLEEQQEEAIVELLGLMTAEKLDNVKDGKLISLLKRLLKEIKAFVRNLLKQREVEIDKLPDNMTLGDIADLLAYSNSKLILPGYEVIYTTPDNQQFKTYAEASKHISELAKSVEDVDLTKPLEKYAVHFSYMTRESDGGYDEQPQIEYFNSLKEAEEYSKRIPDGLFDRIEKIENFLPKSFIERNKEYEQSREIIEEWKKVNNIQYNPEEVYSRGQEFVSVVGAYSDFDVNLMMQNLLQHIEDNQKAGGEFTISAFTKPVDKQISHLEGGGGKIKFKIYPQSTDIKWAANTDVFSGSVWDASEKVSKDKKSELLGVSYTKYPSLENVNVVQPNLAAIVDDLLHNHNELGISLTGSNFRLEYDENIPYSTKKLIDSINSILEQKYGKVVKPEIKQPREKRRKAYAVIYNGIEQMRKDTIEEAKAFVKLHASKWNRSEDSYSIEDSYFLEVYEGIQPTQTNETLKEHINSVQYRKIQEYEYTLNPITKEKYDKAIEKSYTDSNGVIGEFTEDGETYYVDIDDTTRYRRNAEGYFEELATLKPKEYTNQAIINTRINRLKEVAKKYPRSLIRSEVRPISGSSNLRFSEDEMPFQKISKSPNKLPQEKLNEQVNNITSKYKNEIKKIYDKLEMYSSDEYIPAKKYIPAVHLIQQYNRDNNNSNYELAMKRYYNRTSKIVVQPKSLIESKENNLLTKDEGNIRMTINDLFKKVDKDVQHEMEIALKIRTIEIKKVSEVPKEYSIMKVADLHHKELTKQYGALEGTIKYFEEITALNKRFYIKEFLNKEELMPFEKKLDDYNANNPGNSHFYQKVNLPTNDKRDKYIFKINFTKVENIADQQNTIISNIEEDNSISLDNKQEEKTDEEIKQELLAKKDFEKKAENIKENIIQYGNVQGKEFSQQKIIFPEDINLTDTQKSMLMNFDAHFPNHSFLTLLEKMLFVEALGDGDIIMYCKI